jgi:hypothetical protein
MRAGRFTGQAKYVGVAADTSKKMPATRSRWRFSAAAANTAVSGNATDKVPMKGWMSGLARPCDVTAMVTPTTAQAIAPNW